MKSNEIRVGNFVLFSGVETKVIPQDFANQCRGINSCEIPNFQPIQLTEEWFLKFGFKKYNDSDIFYFWESSIFSIERKKNIFKIYVISEISISEIKFVHQLQNLYWCLVGKELEFKEIEKL